MAWKCVFVKICFARQVFRQLMSTPKKRKEPKRYPEGIVLVLSWWEEVDIAETPKGVPSAKRRLAGKVGDVY